MNLKVSREWTTPLTIGIFTLMAVTGLLMFFHLDNNVQKVVHEWAGWMMVVGVGLHAAANWLGLKRYFQQAGRGLAIVGTFAVVTMASFLMSMPGSAGSDQAQSPPAMAIGALTRAPIATVAPVFGKSAEQARSDLAAVGLLITDDHGSIASAAAGSREKIGAALRALAKKS